MLAAMNIIEITAYLQQHSAMRLAQDYRLPLRTLVRIKGGHCAPRAATIALISKAIKRDSKKQAT
jgi:hypothetical protein